MKNIYIDLDGTIIDVFPRSYAIYRDLLLSLDEKYLSYKKYNYFKRDSLGEKEILRKTVGEQKKIEKILEKRIKLLEQPKYLEKDKILEGTKGVLEEMARHFRLYLITQRRNRKNLLGQLRQLKLDCLFEKVLSTVDDANNNVSGNWEDKLRLILDQKESKIANSVIIGDSENDIKISKALGLKVIAVLTGIRSKKALNREKPDFIVDNMQEAMKILLITK